MTLTVRKSSENRWTDLIYALEGEAGHEISDMRRIDDVRGIITSGPL